MAKKPHQSKKPARANLKPDVVKGPHLSAMLFCETVLDEKDGVLSFIRNVDTFKVVPVEHPTSKKKIGVNEVYAVIILKSGEVVGQRRVWVEIVSPSGKRHKNPESEVYFPGGVAGVTIVGKIQLAFDEEGIYWHELFVEGTLLTRAPISFAFETSGAAAEPESS